MALAIICSHGNDHSRCRANLWSATCIQSKIAKGNNMKKWRCVICDYIHEGPEPPETCPECGAGRENFEEYQG